MTSRHHAGKPRHLLHPRQSRPPRRRPLLPLRPQRHPRPRPTDRCDQRRTDRSRTLPLRAAPPAPVAAAAPAPVAAAAASDPNSPIGIWATEENKGNVRIEQCGGNLCGYAVKTNEKILINMKPQGAKWTGRIHDPDSGRNYDSTIAMKGTECAAGPGLRLRRHVLRRPDLEARQLISSPRDLRPCGSPQGLLYVCRLAQKRCFGPVVWITRLSSRRCDRRCCSQFVTFRCAPKAERSAGTETSRCQMSASRHCR